MTGASERTLPLLWPVVTILSLAVVNAVLLFVFRLWSSGDNLDYMLFVRSLQHGEWAAIRGWRFPPGYPALAASVLRMAGITLPQGILAVPSSAFLLLKILNVLIFGGASLVVMPMMRRSGACRAAAWWTALLFSANQAAAVFATFISTEMLYMLLSFAALASWQEAATISENQGSRAWLGAMFAAMAISVRGVGIALPVAAVIAMVLSLFGRQRRLPPVVWLAALTPILVYGVFALWSGGNREHMLQAVSSQPLDYESAAPPWTRVAGHAGLYACAASDVVIPKVLGAYGLLDLAGLRFLTPAWRIAILTLMIIGLWRVVHGRGLLAHIYVAVYLAVICLWPHKDARFLLPLLPFFIWYLVEGLMATCRLLPEPSSGRVFYLVLALLLAWNVAVNVFAGAKNWRTRALYRGRPPWAPERYEAARESDFAEHMRAAEWIARDTPTNAIIFCAKAAFMELASGRVCRYYPAAMDPVEAWREIASATAAAPCYIVEDAFDARSAYGRRRMAWLMPVIESRRDDLAVVYEGSLGSRVYRVLLSGAPPRTDY